jgi:hypothetical protein
MEWLWVAQVTVNFLFLIGMVFWWTDRKSQRARAMEVQLRSTMAELERRATNLDVKARETQQRMDEQFSLIAAVGTQAQALLARGREEIAQRLPTLEEQELLGFDPPRPSTPRTENVDYSPTEAPLGLKAVLREQLF